MTPPVTPLWAYTYKLVPPQPASRLRAIRALLDREHGEAKSRAARWEGRLVVDDRVSHILVVAESPELDLAANRRIQAALRALKADYELTVPMPATENPHDTTRTPGAVVPPKD